MPETYYIDTMGCQMNERDSETIAGVLEELGFAPSDTWENARVIVLNTCSVREKPHHKVFSRLGEFAPLKRERPDTIIAVCGCMAQIVPGEIRKRAPFVDIILGPRNVGDLREAVLERRGRVIVTDTAARVPEGLPARRKSAISAYVNIAFGCNNYCSYCVVPYARGRELSRLPDDILGEIRGLCSSPLFPVGSAGAAQGEGPGVRTPSIREVTLLGQNVNSYGQGLSVAVDFADLLAEINDIPGLERIRFTTSHPKDLSDKLIHAMASLAKVCEHIHLPLQSGDDHVLAAMNRRYTISHYLDLVRRTREAVPGVAITTDIIVGFPGETDKQFQHTMDASAEIRFDQAFLFKYNDRPGTKAAKMPDKVEGTVKQERLLRIVKLQNDIAREVNCAQEGQVFEVMVEGPDSRQADHARGRTRQNKLMIFPGPDIPPGTILPVRAEKGFLWGYMGTAE